MLDAVSVAKNYDWDDKLDLETCKAIECWVKDLKAINKLSIPRCLSVLKEKTVDKEIHIFVDASEDAYAAVAYLRSIFTNENSESVLIASKTTVAPLEAISIPRLELLAAELGSELSVKLMDTLGIEKTKYSSGQIPKMF